MNTQNFSIVTTLLFFLTVSFQPLFAGNDTGTVSILMGGDFYSGERLFERNYQENPKRLVQGLLPLTRDVDLRLLNLEAPITTHSETEVEKRFHLSSPPEIAIPVLKLLKVDGVSLANNHIMDFGYEGMIETKRNLHMNGIEYAGAGRWRSVAERPVFFERNGKRIGFLAFSNTWPTSFWAGASTPGTAFGHPDRVKDLVEYTSRYSDYTVVSFHWGGELNTEPREYQFNLGRLAVSSGADIVFGHHPHIIQPMEFYEDGVIFYSLGNFLFTTLSRGVDYGLVPRVELSVDKGPVVKLNLINVNNYEVHYRPNLVLENQTPEEISRYLGWPNFLITEEMRLSAELKEEVEE